MTERSDAPPSSGSRELYRSALLVVDVDVVRSIVRCVRTPGVGDLPPDMRAAVRSMVGLARGRFGLLVDVREAPFNNDPEFERRMKPELELLYANFAAVAIVVKSAVGRMQVRRQASEVGERAHVFNVADDALAYLLTALHDAPASAR
ncbi:MAG TPA: hypothetical protein VGM56_22950 [Byssovorax sp.]